MKKNKHYISGLDGLRAMAIIAVTLFHFFPQAVKGGYLGVVLFFVLTGYLLAVTSARQEKSGGFRAAAYYKKRVKRIYPELALVVFVTLGLFTFFAPSALKGTRSELLSVFLGYNNWWQIARNADYFTRIANASAFTHLWFLGIELQFYLVWPLIFLAYRGILRRGGKTPALTFLGVLTAAAALIMPLAYRPGMDVTRLYYGTDTRVYALFFGAFLGMLREADGLGTKRPKASRQNSLIGTAAFFAILAVTVIACLTLDGQAAFTYRGGMLIMTVLFGVLLVLTADPRRPFGAALEANRVLAFLGKRSYGIFLWQYPVLFFFNLKGWAFPGVQAVEIALVLLFSAWSGIVCDILTKGKTKLTGPFKFERIVIIFAAAAFALVLVAAGGVGLVRSGGPKASDTGRLRRQLARNQAALKQQKTGRAHIVTANEHGDYSKTGNTAKVSVTSICAVGDSILLDASQEVSSRFGGKIYIDAKKARHMAAVTPILRRLKQQGRLPQTIVLVAGTNGPLDEKSITAVLNLATADRSVFWVTTYGPALSWTAANNRLLRQAQAAHKNLTLIDWQAAAAGHSGYFYEDGLHPNPAGNKAFADLIYNTVKPIADRQAKIDQADALTNPFAY